ncbi:hypothetical protein KKB18_07715 [bacterium]|nr:hypothetical protein [bacterium]
MSLRSLLIIIASLFFFNLPFTLLAMDLIVNDGFGSKGETVEINIDLNTHDGEEVFAFGLEFNYDIENLRMVNEDMEVICDLIPDFIIQSNDPQNNGSVIIGGYTTDNPIPENSSGCFLKILLEVRAEASYGDYPMTLDKLEDNLVGAYIKNGTFSIISGDFPPTLSDAAVIPDSGNQNTFFEYMVNYKDPDGGEPLIKRIFINEKSKSMNVKSATSSNILFNLYISGKELNVGNNQYYFFFEDDEFNMVRYPEVGAFSGPTVISGNTPTPTATPTCTPTPTSTEQTSLSKKILWQIDKTNKVDTVITIINKSENSNSNSFAFFDDSGSLISEIDLSLKPQGMRLMQVSKVLTTIDNAKGYAILQKEDDDNFALWSALINENVFQGYTLPVIEPSLENKHIIPFWQVIPHKIDTQISCQSSHVCGTDMTLTLYSTDGTIIDSTNYSFPPNEMGRVNLSEIVDYPAMGSASVEFSSSGLSGSFVTGIVTNYESNTSYPLMVDHFFRANSGDVESTSISVPFWQILQYEGVDTLLAIQNPDEINYLNLKLSVFNAYGIQIQASDLNVAPLSMKLLQFSRFLPEGTTGFGSAVINIEDGTINLWSAIYKASNQTGYILSADLALSPETKTIPFWQYDPEKKINTYIIVKNLGDNNTDLTFDLLDLDGNFISNNIYTAAPHTVNMYALSDILNEKGYGYGFIRWLNSPVSLWGLIYSSETGTGFTIEFE